MRRSEARKLLASIERERQRQEERRAQLGRDDQYRPSVVRLFFMVIWALIWRRR